VSTIRALPSITLHSDSVNLWSQAQHHKHKEIGLQNETTPIHLAKKHVPQIIKTKTNYISEILNYCHTRNFCKHNNLFINNILKTITTTNTTASTN